MTVLIFCLLLADHVNRVMSEDPPQPGIPGNLCMNCGVWDAGPYWCSFCGAT